MKYMIIGTVQIFMYLMRVEIKIYHLFYVLVYDYN